MQETNEKSQISTAEEKSTLTKVRRPIDANGKDLVWRDEAPDKEGWWWHKYGYLEESLIGITQIWDIDGEMIVNLEHSNEDRTLSEHIEIIKKTAKVQWAGPIALPTD